MIQQQSPSSQVSPKKAQSESSRQSDGEQQSIYYTKNKKIIYWLYVLVCISFVVSEATLVSQNWNKFENFTMTDSYYLANQVALEWKKGFITDVLVATTPCPEGYDAAFNFTWPGTSFGCYCQVDVNSSFVIEGYCSPKLIQSSCRNIQSQQPIYSTRWKNSSNICIRRSSTSFNTEEKYNGNNKICGSSKSLTIMPSTEPCPLVNASFSLPQLEDHYRLLSDSTRTLDNFYGVFNATSPYSFYTYPISKFMVSEYEFCLIDEDSGLTPNRVEFVLLNQKRGCADEGSYQTLDSITEIQFYENNPELNNLKTIQGFPKPGNQIYNLGFANLASWTYNCRHNYDKKFSIPKALEIINFEFFSSYYYVALVQILFYSFLGFQLFILVIRRLLKKEVYPIGYRQMYLPQDFCYALARYLIDFISKFVVLGLLIYTAWVIFVNWNWFKSALNLNCPDSDEQLVTKVMEPFRTMYQQSIKYVIAQLVVFTFVAIIDIVHFVYIYKNELKYYLVDSYGKVMVEHDAKDDLEWIDDGGKAENKLLNIQTIDKDGFADVNDAASDKFRVTMAMNVFENERPNQEAGRSKILKKKKKKLGGFKKDYQNLDNRMSDQFNPFSIDDPTILGLNSIDNLSGDRKVQESDNSKGKKTNDRRRRKK